MKNVLITGANGQLGRELQLQFSGHDNFKIFATDVSELDITDKLAVASFVECYNIDFIINCAAYTAVDAAEDNGELCRKLNVDAVANLAEIVAEYGSKLLHISTDYVFDGYAYKPYNEDDTVNPLSVYGRTKSDGEIVIKQLAPNSIIIRTAWLYSPHGKNFVKTMLSLGTTRSELNVVYDQVGTPTSATDLAHTILLILSSGKWEPGIYHFSNEGVVSWYDFTKAIHRIAGIGTCHVRPVLTAEYPTKAHRPCYSVLDKSKIKRVYNIDIPYWEDSLIKCINRIKE